MQSNLPYVNIAAYKFISLDNTAEMRPQFLRVCKELELKGTVLLSPEGINLFLAGLREPIDQFLAWLRSDSRFADLEVKESYSATQPFKRMLVKLKREIITMNNPLIRPELERAPAVDAVTLKRWLDQGQDDEGKPVVMLDTRNAFEVDAGTFRNTVDFRIAKFSEFPQVVAEHKDEFADKTVVTFCTGGIRCEKAAIYMQNVGFNKVYQLEGGILKYFEETGGAHYDGDCFVFDERVALKPDLAPTDAIPCKVCGTMTTPRERQLPQYVEGVSCPHCIGHGNSAARNASAALR